MRWIGRSVRPLDWQAQTSGQFRYGSDLLPEGTLVGRILRSPYRHALIESIDTTAARALPGVHAVITMADFPSGVRYLHEGAADRPPLADGVARFIGEEVAAVAAETEQAAEAALAAIRVRWRRLAAPLTIARALEAGATRLHRRPPGNAPNVSRRAMRQWGDAAKGQDASTVRVSGRFMSPAQTHVCLEPNMTLAEWNRAEERLHLWTGTQSPVFVCKEVAHVMKLRLDQVVCHEVGIGGGFGSKSKVCEHQAIAGMLALRSGRPVRIAFTREEEFEGTKTRHRFEIALQLHADSEARLRAVDGRVLVDNGAYNHTGWSVMAAGIKALGSLYRPDGLAVEGLLVDTANLPGGSFRGYGSSQATFALESLMDQLAGKLGKDPIEFRLRNANQPFETMLVGSRVQSARLAECLAAARDAIGWTEKKAERRPGRGVGVGTSVHVSGAFGAPEGNRNGGAIDVYADGHLRVRFGGADCGTGQKTILAQIAAEETGVPPECIDVLSMDSERTPYDQGAWGSRGTYFSGHSTRLAAQQAALRLKELAAARLNVEPSSVTLVDGRAEGGGNAVSIGDLVAGQNDSAGMLTFEAMFIETGVEMADPVTGIGNISGTYSFAAHAAEVDVDCKTGRVRLVDYVAAHDIGRVLNPILAEGQTVGGAAMGIGGALGEELVREQGKLVNPSLMHYALPRAADLPRIRAILVEGDDPKAPYGAKGVGELGHTPAAPAIANAIYDAIGVRICELPITPDKILDALAQKQGRRRRHGLWRRPARWWIALVRWAYPRGLLRALHRPAVRLASRIQRPPLRELQAPATLSEALSLLGPGAMPLAGGTDLLPRRRQGLAAPARLVSLDDIDELRRLAVESNGDWTIGARVTLAALEQAKGVAPILAEAIATIASAQVRAMATVGGNLLQDKRCWFYRSGFDCYKRTGKATSPCYAVAGDHRFHHAAIDGHRCQATTPSDLATVITALDARATLRSTSGVRIVAMDSFFVGPGESVLAPGELLESVTLPATALGRRGVFRKLRLWEGDFALVSVALSATLDAQGQWAQVRLVFGGLAPVPWRARRTEARLEGRIASVAELRSVLDDELDAAAHPLPRNGWKLDAAAGLAERAAEALLAAERPG